MNGIERSATQLIDANEELFDIAEDDRGFGTPTVWIGVMKLLFAKQHAALAQQFDNVAVGVEDVFANKVWQTGFLSEAAVIVHRRQNWQFILPA